MGARVQLLIAASLVVSVVSATAAHAKSKHAHDAPPPEIDMDDDASAAGDDTAGDEAAPADEVAAEDPPADDEVDATPEPVAHHHRAAARDWHLALGPYAWASAVDASVSANGMNLDTSGAQVQGLQPTIKYGGELMGEARYSRVALTGDLIFGAIGLDGGSMAGPATITFHGDVAAMMLDSGAGVTIIGNEHSVFAAEVRGGIRYERVSFHVSADISGGDVEKKVVFGGSDTLAGGRIFFRPSRRWSFTGSADVGITGASSQTWSATAEASARVSTHVQLSLAYRTLTIQRATVDLVFHGPRLALAFLF
jgi:hypothetical protein